MTVQYIVHIDSPTDRYFERRFEVASDKPAPELARWLAQLAELDDPGMPVHVQVWTQGAKIPAGEAHTAPGRPQEVRLTYSDDAANVTISTDLLHGIIAWLRQASADLDDERDGTPEGEHARIAARFHHELTAAQMADLR